MPDLAACHHFEDRYFTLGYFYFFVGDIYGFLRGPGGKD